MTDSVTIGELQALVGHKLGTSGWFKLDQDRISAFAEITEDPQFIHVDPERAKAETSFGGTIAHGFLTLSLLSAMGLQVFPKITGKRMTINYGMDKMRFLAPVPSGARIRSHVTLTSLEEKPAGKYLCRYTSSVEIEDHETPALIADQLALYLMGDDA